MKKYFLYIILPVICFICTLTSSAQNLGITTPGTTNYPQTTIGNTTTELNNNGGNFLIFDSVRTTVPLTAIAIRTYGSVSGTISVTIYNNNGGTPGTKLFTEVAASVTANTLSTITIPNAFLPAGVYWLAYDMNSSSASANFITKLTTAPGTFVRKSMTLTYGSTFPNNPAVGNLAAGIQDHIAFVGVPIEGYAKATKAVLGTNGTFSSVSFYSHAAGNVRLAIFSDNAGVPNTKRWESGDVAVSASAWTTVNISSGTPTSLVLTAGTYWLAWQWNSAASGPSYTAGAANTGNFIIQSYGAFPSSWSGGTASTENWSMYATYVACTTPTAYNVTGGGGYCSGGSGVAIGLSGSQTNVNYQLFNGASPVGSPVAGTGSAISFGNQTTAGTYTVTATTATGGCTNSMTGSATVTVNALPSASVTGQSNLTCYLSGNGSITISGSGTSGPYMYSIDNGNNYNNAPYYQGGGTFGGLPAGTYQIRVKDNNQCESKQVQ